ncbi:catalase family protein [Spirosoma sp. KUDC1026]|uniref:catalase family protein n=1 Tax=Spirosoma sp. KUDC1026 TaxID=2745947 RepID=UPI00159B8FB3|nr:catalase family protein [Spirosoma sp. KUDC1026]QKZ13990.1 catalase family protein [Spirosoma sp. KUDC1026]
MTYVAADFLPLPYNPSYEQPEPDEAQTIREIIDTMAEIQQKTYQSQGHAIRSVHAKGHALLKGEFQVFDNLPAYLAQGLFAKPGTYPIVARISTQPGDVLPDSVSTPRGISIKVSGVAGEHLPGADELDTQDFIVVNSPVFPQKLKDFLSGLKRFDALTNKAEGFKEGLSKVLRTAGEVVENLGGSDAGIMPGMGGQLATHPMGDRYYSQVAYLYGDYMAKFSLTPVSPNLTALKDQSIDIDSDDNALRHLLQDFFATNGGEWEFGVQLSTDIEKMPIEDASVEWSEDESPYIIVGKLTIAPQDSWTDERVAVVDDKMSFSPWHGLAAHRPLGVIQRARRASYQASADFRRGLYGKTSNPDDVK